MGTKGIRSEKLGFCKKCGEMFLKTGRGSICLGCLRDSSEAGRGKSVTRELTYEYLVNEYKKKKRSLDDIAKEHGCSRTAVMKIMEKYRLARRGRSEARIEAISKGKFERLSYQDISKKLFKRWAPEMTWVLGLLFTDGNMHGNLIELTSVDLELLETVRALFKSSRPIQKRTQSYDKSKHIYAFAFSHPKIAEDLRQLGLHERKSLDMVFPIIPEEYMRHFIRGCWDGDGSIFISGGELRASYVTGSLKFIEGLVQELYKAGIHKIKRPYGGFPLTIHESKRSQSYDIKIDGRENLEKLFHYFYDEVDESMYLARKCEVFTKGLGCYEGTTIVKNQKVPSSEGS